MIPYANTAYAQPVTPVRTPRDTEYEVIARITQALSAAIATRAQNKSAFLEALFRNERLWSTFAADVADAGNGLPAPLRAQLFYLYRFTTEHSRKVRNGSASAEVLVEVNRAVLRGLRGGGA